MTKVTVKKEPNGRFSMFLQHRRGFGMPSISVSEANRDDIVDIVKQEQEMEVAMVTARSRRLKAERAV